jgi:hypothetical protein
VSSPTLGYGTRRTYVVVWDCTGEDDFGQPKVSDEPEEILVRWETIKRDVVDPKGRKVAVDVQISLNRDIAPGSVVWLGQISDLATGTDSGTDDDYPGDVRRVVTFESIPDVKGRATERFATLARDKETFPTRES